MCITRLSYIELSRQPDLDNQTIPGIRNTDRQVKYPLVQAYTPQQMTAQALPANTPKVEELESIRGLAALLVVFFHIPKWNPILDVGIIKSGYLMVELFFVLSGFVMFNAYAHKIGSKTDLIRFQFLRFGRLYPVHIFFLLIFLAIEIAKYIAVTRLGTTDISRTPFGENSISAFIEQVFLLQAVGPTGNALTFNFPAWSISVEFYVYLIFGLAVLLTGRIRNHVFGMLAVIALLMLITNATYGFTDMLRCVAGFFVGCLTASFVRTAKIGLPKFASLFFLAAIILFLQLKSLGSYDVVIYFLTAALIASLMLSPGGGLKAILSHKILTWLGTISYSLYMSHALCLWLVTIVFKRLLKRPEAPGLDGKLVLTLSTGETVAAVAFAVALVLIGGQITYSLIEKPLREKSRRFAFSKLS